MLITAIGVIALAALLLSPPPAPAAAEEAKPARCILVFGAHADDVEGMAGGTFASYIHDKGYKGVYAVVTNNTAGCQLNRTSRSTLTISSSPHVYPAGALETIQIRTEEARRGAAVFGATPVFLDFRETWIWHGRKRSYIGTDEFHRYDPPGRQVVSVATRLSEDVDLVVDLLGRHRPDITIIHTMGGAKHDHGNSGYLMYLAFRRAMAQGIPVGKLWMQVAGWLREPEARDSGRGVPDVRVDVTGYLDMKHRALSQHVSQKGGMIRPDLKVGQRQYEEFITVFDNTAPRDRSELRGPVPAGER